MSWANVRLPKLTRLRLTIFTRGVAAYTGFAAFLTAHYLLRHLDLSMLVLSVADVTELVRQPQALPNLARLTIRYHISRRSTAPTIDFVPLITALATTAVSESGEARRMEWLQLEPPTTREVFSAAALLPGLVRLQVEVGGQTTPGWIEEWTKTPAMRAALPLLQECEVDTLGQIYDLSRRILPPRDIANFLESMAARPLQVLDIHTGTEPISFSKAAFAQLARFTQLRELRLVLDICQSELNYRDDWTGDSDETLLAALTPSCLPSLHTFCLKQVRLGAYTVESFAAAAPQLLQCELSGEFTCHAAVLCAIVGAYCEHIEQLEVIDASAHMWSDASAEWVACEYEMATTEAGRGQGWKPFTRLRQFYACMCLCTPASVWHALLRLMTYAVHVHCVDIATVDPLIVSALSYLPHVFQLGSECMWPRSFTQFIAQPDERTGEHRYVSPKDVSGCRCYSCSPSGAQLSLSDGATDVDEDVEPVRLAPDNQLFAAYQRTLSAEQQAVLARWKACEDFEEHDDKVSAAETRLMSHRNNARAYEPDKRCAHPHIFYCWEHVKDCFQPIDESDEGEDYYDAGQDGGEGQGMEADEQEEGKEEENGVDDVGDDAEESDDEMKQG